MTKSELKEKIRSIIKQVLGKNKPVDFDMPGFSKISLDVDTLPILVRFPELKNVIVDLLTDSFNLFVDDVLWMAPKPTTFRIDLKNGQKFYLIFTDRSWIAKIEGKEYYLLNIDELEKATISLSRLLLYSAPEQPKKETISSEKEEKPIEEPEN